MSSQQVSAGTMLSESYANPSPLDRFQAVRPASVPASVPDELQSVLSVHRGFLKEAIEDTVDDGRERAVTICGPSQPITSDLITGTPVSVNAPSCGTGDLSVALHTHPDQLSNPILSVADMAAAVERDFDWVVALGGNTSEAVRAPAEEELEQLEAAGLSRGLDLIRGGGLTGQQAAELRQIHNQLRDTSVFSRFNSSWIGATIPFGLGISRLFQVGSDTEQPVPTDQVFILIMIFIVLFFGLSLLGTVSRFP